MTYRWVVDMDEEPEDRMLHYAADRASACGKVLSDSLVRATTYHDKKYGRCSVCKQLAMNMGGMV